MRSGSATLAIGFSPALLIDRSPSLDMRSRGPRVIARPNNVPPSTLPRPGRAPVRYRSRRVPPACAADKSTSCRPDPETNHARRRNISSPFVACSSASRQKLGLARNSDRRPTYENRHFGRRIDIDHAADEPWAHHVGDRGIAAAPDDDRSGCAAFLNPDQARAVPRLPIAVRFAAHPPRRAG